MKIFLWNLALLLVLTACQSGGLGSEASDSTHSENDGHIHAGHDHENAETVSAKSYTCPMHPQIVEDKPGTCPICAMDLVPVTKTGSKAAEVMLGESQVKLAGIRVEAVASGTLGNATTLNARLAADQEGTEVISSRAAGRIERLAVKEIGQPVLKGQVLYELYSEALSTYQQEYLVALQQEVELGKTETRYASFRRAAEQRLLLYGMTAAQIEGLARTRQVQPRIPFVAPASGTVTEIAATEGQYVGEGALLYRLVNLGRLWVEAELYAGEAANVKVGQTVPVRVVGYETEPLTARVSFINPEFRAGSQVLVLRAALANPGGRFQPGMPARVLIQHGTQRGLTLPTDAVVRDARGSVVFVETAANTFQPRLVKTGTETEDRVAVTSGLTGDERVAMAGAYLLYSELILKKGVNPMTAQTEETGVESTPNSESNPAPQPQAHAAPAPFKRQLTAVYQQSLGLTEALILSDAGKAKGQVAGLKKALGAVDMALLKGPAHTDWMGQLSSMNSALKQIETTNDVEAQRTAYAGFEDALYRSVKAFGIDKPAYRQFCPMALGNKGAYWLSDKKPIRNPYFGDAMLTCGETKETL